MYFSLNGETSIEPRLGLKWKLKNEQSLSVGTGLYSQVEPYGIYLLDRSRPMPFNQPKQRLRLSKSFHNVLAYDKRFDEQTRFMTEFYYDRGFDIPVGNDLNSSFSVINTYYLYNVLSRSQSLVSKGTTTNYGVDVTLKNSFHEAFIF